MEVEATKVKEEMVPHVALYYDVLGLLPNPNQLINYAFGENDRLTINASFKSLDDVADYIARLTEQNYSVDTELTQASSNEDSYDATLTIIIDKERLVEELAHK